MSKILRKISSKWQIYRYRFVPWIAWSLKERTVRSVQDASQDRIVADDLVEDTYRRLFTSLEDNLPDPEGGDHKQDKLHTDSNKSDRSKVNPVTKISGDEDGDKRCYHHGNASPESCTERCSFQKSLFQRTCDRLKDKSSWTFLSERRAACNVDVIKHQQLNLVQRLLQFPSMGTKGFFEVLSMNAGCRGVFEIKEVLMRKERRASSTTQTSSCHGGIPSCSHHQCCDSALFLHPPPPSPHHPHHLHPTHHHSNWCHSDYHSTNMFLRQIHDPPSRPIGRQRSISTNNNAEHSIGDTSEEMGDALDPGATIMHQTLGFAIGRRQSQIEGGGIGVYVIKGVVPKGVVVAMYPGTIYYPAEPILFQSIANPFIFRCLDGIHIDGHDKRLSKMIFRSCSQRDRLGPYMFSDLSWLTPCPLNPMAVGQYVNNQHKGVPANVCYQEFDVPLDFPLKLRKYIPNAFFGTLPDVGNSGRSMRTVALVSLREIQCGEELLSAYFTLIY